MTEWNFQLRLNREPTEAEFDALYRAGLSDTGIEGTLVDVDREAPSLLLAVASVARQIRTVPGLRAVGVETQDAVTLTDAAQRLGRRTAESLRLLAEGKRGPGGFPAPIVDSGKLRVYSFVEITVWLREALGEDIPTANCELVLADRLELQMTQTRVLAARWAAAATGRALRDQPTSDRPHPLAADPNGWAAANPAAWSFAAGYRPAGEGRGPHTTCIRR